MNLKNGTSAPASREALNELQAKEPAEEAEEKVDVQSQARLAIGTARGEAEPEG